MVSLTQKKAQAILKGQHKLVVWGGTDDVTAYEWQRQIKADFLVDTRWGWWHHTVFHGLPVCSPSEISHLRPAQTTVFNNFCYTNADSQVAEYLQRIGHQPAIDPPSLAEIARTAHLQEKKKTVSLASSPHFIETVNTGLEDILTPADALDKKRHFPSYRELLSFFAAYNHADYIRHALPLYTESLSASLKPRSGHVALLIHSLIPGGAERQLANLAIGLKRCGWTPTVLRYAENKNESPVYLQMLKDEGVAYQTIVPPAPDGDPSRRMGPMIAALSHEAQMLLWHLHPTYTLRTVCVYHALRQLRPELFISYLDGNNIPGGFGALLAGVPRTILSGRSTARSNVTTPPYLKQHEINRQNYGILAQQPSVFLSNNSPGGAESYAKWIGIPPKKFTIVRNSVGEEFTHDASASAISLRRMIMGLNKKQPLILGLFRLHPVKRPMDFIRVIAALHKKNPQIRAVICGSLDFEVEEIRALIRQLKLEDVLTLTGAIQDVPTLLGMATLVLHTAEIEGSPNAVLEAQAMGVPVVAAQNTGVELCLDEKWKRYMRKPGDIRGLTASCQKILHDLSGHKRLAAQIKRQTRKERSLAILGQETLQIAGLSPHTKKKTKP